MQYITTTNNNNNNNKKFPKLQQTKSAKFKTKPPSKIKKQKKNKQKFNKFKA